jgi:hypothetical protein
MREIGTQIYDAVRLGRLQEPFTPKMVQKACPGWAKATYGAFLPKHAEGNPGKNTVLFVRVSTGSYCLKNSS